MSSCYMQIVQISLAAVERSCSNSSHLIELHGIHLRNHQKALHVHLIISLVISSPQTAQNFSTTEASPHPTTPDSVIPYHKFHAPTPRAPRSLLTIQFIRTHCPIAFPPHPDLLPAPSTIPLTCPMISKSTAPLQISQGVRFPYANSLLANLPAIDSRADPESSRVGVGCCWRHRAVNGMLAGV